MLAQLPNMQKPGATRQTWQKHVGQTCPNMFAKLVQTCLPNMTKHVGQTCPNMLAKHDKTCWPNLSKHVG
jgi:hypothetical protein